MSGKSRNISNTLWNMTDTVMYPVIFLALTPFFLHHLGEKMFGVYMLCVSIWVSLQALNLGLGTSTLRNVARFHKTGDVKKINETINTNLSFSIILVLACVGIGFMVALLVNYAGLFHIENNLKTYAAYCIFIASAIGGMKFCEQILQFSFKGFERFDIAAQFNITLRIGTLAINALMVWAGYSIMSMLLANLAVTATMLVLQVAGLKKIFPLYVFSFHYSKARISEELNFGVWIWLQSLVIIITYQTDRYVVTYIGLETLSYYALTATIFNHIQMMISSLIPWLFPRIAGMKERNEDIVPFYHTMQATVVAFGLISLVIFYLLREPVLTLWVGPEKFLRLDQYIPLFTGFVMFSICTIVPIAFLNASGFEKLSFRISALLGFFTISSVFLCYLFTHSAKGVITGLITGIALFLPVMHYSVYKITGRKNFARDIFLTLLPPIAGLLLILSPDNFFKALYFLLMLLTLRLIYFTKENFDIKWLKY